MQHLHDEAMNRVPNSGVSLCLVLPNLTVKVIAKTPRKINPQDDPANAVETERPSRLSRADALSCCNFVRIGNCQKAWQC